MMCASKNFVNTYFFKQQLLLFVGKNKEQH